MSSPPFLLFLLQHVSFFLPSRYFLSDVALCVLYHLTSPLTEAPHHLTSAFPPSLSLPSLTCLVLLSFSPFIVLGWLMYVFSYNSSLPSKHYRLRLLSLPLSFSYPSSVKSRLPYSYLFLSVLHLSPLPPPSHNFYHQATLVTLMSPSAALPLRLIHAPRFQNRFTQCLHFVTFFSSTFCTRSLAPCILRKR